MYAYLLFFLIVLFLLGQQKEHMEQRTHKLQGPEDANLYDPSFKHPHNKREHDVPYTPAGEFGPDSEQIPVDNGLFESNNASRQYSIYFYKPFASLPFPTSGPPQPYVTDFAPFQR